MICLQRVNTKSDARAVILQCLCEYDLVDHDIVPVMSRVFDSSVFTNEATLFSKLIIEKIQENIKTVLSYYGGVAYVSEATPL